MFSFLIIQRMTIIVIRSIAESAKHYAHIHVSDLIPACIRVEVLNLKTMYQFLQKPSQDPPSLISPDN